MYLKYVGNIRTDYTEKELQEIEEKENIKFEQFKKDVKLAQEAINALELKRVKYRKGLLQQFTFKLAKLVFSWVRIPPEPTG